MTDAVKHKIPTAPNDPEATAGSTPHTGRTRPSSASSTQQHGLLQPPGAARTLRSADSTATAKATSKSTPTLF
jgi:hypothetical protein